MKMKMTQDAESFLETRYTFPPNERGELSRTSCSSEQLAESWTNQFFLNRGYAPDYNAYQQIYSQALSFFMKEENKWGRVLGQ